MAVFFQQFRIKEKYEVHRQGAIYELRLPNIGKTSNLTAVAAVCRAPIG
jgi:hypothetical protein